MSIHPPSPAHNSSRTTVRRARYTESLLNRAYTDALPILRAAIADEDALAMGLLGTLYMLGHGVDKDEQEAYLWFRQGAVRGDVPSIIGWQIGHCGPDHIINRAPQGGYAAHELRQS